MRSTDLEARLRQFETAPDNPLPLGFQLLVRRDGRGFTRLTKAERLLGMARADKHELLFQSGVNFDALPTWQKRGFAVYWVERERDDD